SNDSAGAGCAVTYTGTGCTGSTCGAGPSTASLGVSFTYTATSSVRGSGGSAITRIQKGSGNFANCQGLTTCSLSISPTQGGSTDLLCALGAAFAPGNVGTLSVTDNKGQTYNTIFNPNNGDGMVCAYP